MDSVFADFLNQLEHFGPPVALAAWGSVLAVSVMMGCVLRRSLTPGIFRSAAVVGALSLAAHITDFAVTLKANPDLSLELNPIWRIVIDQYGLSMARLYGLTGKTLLAILCFEFYAYYLVNRPRLAPVGAQTFRAFWAAFGGRNSRGFNWGNAMHFFAYAFAMTGPFYFYVALKNSLIAHPAYFRCPSVLSMLVIYLLLVTAGYFTITYRACRIGN